MHENVDVAIVGYGPTGMAAASLLGRLGLSVVVIERWPGLYGLPRLTHIDDETARTIQAAADIEDALRDSTPTENLWVNGADETLLVIPALDGQMGYPAHISMYQPDIESAIDRRIREYSTVSVRQGWALADLDQDADGVNLTIGRWVESAIATSGREKLRARYVIAADGAKSGVRELMGVPREDLGFNERWVNVDTEWLRTPDPSFGLTKQFCDPARGHMFMAIGAYRQRFEYAVLESDDPDRTGTEAEAWSFLADMHGLTSEDVRIVRRIVYTFEARIASHWRIGRVFLAGDAAHTMPPYLGQGACSGIRDANNLAWRLGMVVTGQSGEELLDSYELERRPHAEVVARMAIGLGRVANMTDPIEAEQRDAAFRAGAVPPPPVMPPILEGALQTTRSGAGAAAVGFLAPQGQLRSDDLQKWGDDILGYGFVLISRTDPRPHLSSSQRTVLDAAAVTILNLEGPIVDVDGTYRDFLTSLDAEAAIVRPDFVLFGSVPSADSIGELVDELASAVHLVHHRVAG